MICLSLLFYKLFHIPIKKGVLNNKNLFTLKIELNI